MFYEATASMTDTRFLDAGLHFDGGGKLWIDDLKIEIADSPAQGL